MLGLVAGRWPLLARERLTGRVPLGQCAWHDRVTRSGRISTMCSQVRFEGSEYWGCGVHRLLDEGPYRPNRAVWRVARRLRNGRMASQKLNAAFALDLMDAVMGRRYAVPLRRGPRLRLPPHRAAPDPSTPAAVAGWVKRADRPTAIDLFCGAGGLSLGLHDAGLRVLVGADIDPLAVETHTANLGGLGYIGDLSDPSDLIDSLKGWGITSVDVVAGGVPCQPFSRAGQSKIRSLVAVRARPERDRRADLWESFIQVVGYLHPKAVLLENVPDLAQWDEGAVLVGFCEALRELGYETEARILHAYDYGVPQHRSRLFIVGILANERRRILWPHKRTPRPTLSDAISDLPPVSAGHREDLAEYDGPKTALQRRLRRTMDGGSRNIVWDHATREVRCDDAAAFALLPEGGTYLDIPEHLRRYRSDIFTDKYKRLSRNELSRTITAHVAKDGYWYIHPTQDRTLSIREVARIQTFPDWFRFAGEPSHRLRQIGNAVPPLLAEALGRCLKRTLSSKNPAAPASAEAGSFREALLNWNSHSRPRHPWRSGTTPWGALLAEMCLRRARPDEVAAVFEDLLALVPSPGDLVAREANVRAWLENLGLRWRIDNIVEVARVLLESRAGIMPSTRHELLALPWVGDQLASAVLSFGFGRIAILMDTNTERIVGRLRGSSRGAGRRWQMRLDLYQLAGRVGATPEFNRALVDLGALICAPSSPRCVECPVKSHCQTGRRQS
jgi:DNA (cytosine-5)-methyltransferase 1